MEAVRVWRFQSMDLVRVTVDLKSGTFLHVWREGDDNYPGPSLVSNFTHIWGVLATLEGEEWTR